MHIVQQHSTAGGSALAKARPVIDDAQARAAPLYEGHDLPTFVVDRLDGDPVGEEGTG
ncbi:hypothetical protein D3C85_1461080 [compost metagenome]